MPNSFVTQMMAILNVCIAEANSSQDVPVAKTKAEDEAF